jgi:hypothetical protein
MNRLLSLTAATVLSLSATGFAAQATEADYTGLTACGLNKLTTLIAGPDLTVYSWEFKGIVPPESTFKPLQNATVHCVGYGRVMQGKQTGMGSCHWTDAAGDTFIGESVDAPDKPGVWTFLSGTGKYNGVTGGGSYSTTAAGKMASDGTMEMCFSPTGKWNLVP